MPGEKGVAGGRSRVYIGHGVRRGSFVFSRETVRASSALLPTSADAWGEHSVAATVSIALMIADRA